MRAIAAFSRIGAAGNLPSAPAGSAQARDRMMRGFTLLEILVALTVSAIAVLLTQPAIATGMLNLQRSTTINGLSAACTLRAARGERGRDTTVCSSPDGLRCGAAEDWDAGWIVHDGPTGSRDAPPRSILFDRGRPVFHRSTHPVRVPAFRGAPHAPDRLDRRGSRAARRSSSTIIARPRLADTPAWRPAPAARVSASGPSVSRVLFDGLSAGLLARAPDYRTPAGKPRRAGYFLADMLAQDLVARIAGEPPAGVGEAVRSWQRRASAPPACKRGTARGSEPPASGSKCAGPRVPAKPQG